MDYGPSFRTEFIRKVQQKSFRDSYLIRMVLI